MSVLFTLAVFLAGADATSPSKENVALEKPAAAKSHQGGNVAALAFDGKDYTRWCADGGQNDEWLQVDLGGPQDLTGCRITWEFGNGSYRYLVEGSADAANWKPLVDATKQTSKEKTHSHTFTTSGVRHVRLTVTDKSSGHWASVTEFEVLGTRDAPEKPTLPPADERATSLLAGVKVPSGFKATLFAAPPEVGYPACLSAAPDGTLFVGIDENGSLDRTAGRGRVVRCRDVNDDGRADAFVEFAKLDSPRGVAWDGDRLYVMHPPKLSVYFDEDGDGRSERSETLVEGLGFDLGFRGADHTTNGIRLGVDGYLYIAVGDYGFVKAVGRDGRTLQLHGGGVVRVRTDGSGLEIISRGQRNIYDVAIDPQMNLFTRDNTNDGGGWNVRLSHVVPGGNYGYPSLFTHFADEIIPPLADYGGGSPCGALYLDEPQAFPAPYGQALYMVEWGASGVMRHELTPRGATFDAKEERFLTLPRPTDMDADARGHLYVSSWKDGGFNYSGPEVGFIVRVTAENNVPATLPDLRKATLAELVEQLTSSSGVMRLAAQRELLRRKDAKQAISQLGALSESLRFNLSAVMFTLAQLRSPGNEPFEFDVIRPITADIKNDDPRVRLVAGRAAVLLANPETTAAGGVARRRPDPIVSHVAVELAGQPARGGRLCSEARRCCDLSCSVRRVLPGVARSARSGSRRCAARTARTV